MFWRKLVIIILLLSAQPGKAAVRLPSVLSPGMVLQRESVVNIWGWATPGEKVTVKASWLDESVTVTTNTSGTWLTRIPTGRAGGPYTLTVKGDNTIVLSDVLVGEVWLCSGQSNMEFTIRMLGGWKLFPQEKKELKKNGYSTVRLCMVKHATAREPMDSCAVAWQHAGVKSVAGFSATAWFFGKCLSDWLGVPVGLICSAIGGTPAEAWTDSTTVASDPLLRYYLASPNAQVRRINRLSGLYNAMIHPLRKYGIRGVIWYQGETNITDADLYGSLFPAMIRNWRNAWNLGDFPFYFVQIAPFDYHESFPAAAYLREAQAKALLLPNTGMAVTMDIGNTLDIHPKNKPAVGQRLALLAMAKTYGNVHVFHSGPVFTEARREGNGFRVFFDAADSLFSKGGTPSCFALAGSDGIFKPARARIEGRTLVVASDSLRNPLFLRYAFNDADSVNLFNQAGLPASAFRTDTISLLVRNVKIDINPDSTGKKKHIVMSCNDKDCRIHYTLNGGDPGPGSPVYRDSILLNGSADVRARAFKGALGSAITSRIVYRNHLGVDRHVSTVFPFSEEYPGGKNALLDGINGSVIYSDGHWQGYLGVDLDAVVDLGAVYHADSVTVSMLEDAGAWIFLPKQVEISVSDDGLNFTHVAEFPGTELKKVRDASIKAYTWHNIREAKPIYIPRDGRSAAENHRASFRYVRVFAKNRGRCPKWHAGKGQKSWLFADEIIIR